MTPKGLRLRSQDGDMFEIELFGDRSAIVRVFEQGSGSGIVRAILTPSQGEALATFLTEKSAPSNMLLPIERYEP